MKKYEVLITEPAERDLYEIRNYIDLLEPVYAKSTLDKIIGSILELEEFPYRNALVTFAELSKRGLRKLLIGNYIVFYFISSENHTVTVVRILYSKRNWKILL